jgi:AAA domain
VDAERALVTWLARTGKGLAEVDAAGIRAKHFVNVEIARVLSFIRWYASEHGKQPPYPTLMEEFRDFDFTIELRDDPISFLIARFGEEIERRLADDFTYDLARAIRDPEQNGKLAELIIEMGVEIASSVPLAEGEEENPSDTWSAHVILGENETPKASILGVVYPSLRHIFSGEPGSMKTWAALACCIHEIEAGRVALFIDFGEGGKEDIYRRLVALGLSDELIAKNFMFVAPETPITTPGARERLDEVLEVMQPSLIVLDASAGALELHGLNENVTEDVQKFYRLIINPLRAGGAAVVVIDHVTKDPDKRGKFAIGSQRKTGVTDVHIGFHTTQEFGQGQTGIAGIERKKDRPGQLPPFGQLRLTSDAASGAVTYSLKMTATRTFRPTGRMEAISRYLERAKVPLGQTNIEENVTGQAKNLRLALDLLVQEDYVRRESGPNRSKLHSILEPYREAEDEGDFEERIFLKESREEGDSDDD